MCPAHAPPSAPSSFSRWTDEEHDILVRTTNKQIELETKDKSQEISWTRHWQRVSQELQEHGYNRTSAACNGHWKRTIESQKATEEAAGPRWDDSEHQILLGMTEDQLALESENPASIIPWPQHWKKVSLCLKENGYTRSPDACAAYWVLVEDNSQLVAGNEIDAEDYSSPEDELDSDSDSEEDTPFQKSPNTEQFTNNLSSTWSPANAVKESRSTDSPEAMSHPPVLSSSNQISSCEPNPLYKLVSNALQNFEISEFKSRALQVEAEKSRTSRNANHSLDQAPASSSEKPKGKTFRFKAYQRSYLDDEVAKNGSSPDAERREKLAKELGVEEKTIRNWFNHYRSRENRRSLEGSAVRNTSGSTSTDYSYFHESSLSNSNTKRVHDSSDRFNPFGDFETEPSIQTQDPSHPLKKPRLDRDSNSFHIEPASVEIVGGQAGIQSQPLASNTRRTESQNEVSAMPLEGLVTSSGPTISEQPKLIPSPMPDPGKSQSSKIRKSEPTTPAARDGEVVEDKRDSQSSSRRTNQFQETNSATPQPATVSSVTRSTPVTESEEKAWASKKLAQFQSEILNLERENTTRMMLVAQIEQEIEDKDREAEKLQQQKADEIAQILKEIDGRYEREHEILKDKQHKLGGSKESELNRLTRNKHEIAQKKTGMQVFQTVVDYYVTLENGS